MFVTNLPGGSTQDDFSLLFSQSGCVSSRLTSDHTGRAVGGYLEFPDEPSAMTARNFYAGFQVDGTGGAGLSLEQVGGFPPGDETHGRGGSSGAKRPRLEYNAGGQGQRSADEGYEQHVPYDPESVSVYNPGQAQPGAVHHQHTQHQIGAMHQTQTYHPQPPRYQTSTSVGSINTMVQTPAPLAQIQQIQHQQLTYGNGGQPGRPPPNDPPVQWQPQPSHDPPVPSVMTHPHQHNRGVEQPRGGPAPPASQIRPPTMAPLPGPTPMPLPGPGIPSGPRGPPYGGGAMLSGGAPPSMYGQQPPPVNRGPPLIGAAGMVGVAPMMGAMASGHAPSYRPPFVQQQKQLPRDASPTIYVEGVPADATVREMAHVFRPFEGFKHTRLVSKESVRGPLCFAEFETAELASSAKDTLQGYLIDRDDLESSSLRISFAKSQGNPPRNAGRGLRGRGASSGAGGRGNEKR